MEIPDCEIVGAGGQFGEEAVGAKHNIDSRASTLDFHVPLQERVVLRAEGFVGSNLTPFQGAIRTGDRGGRQFLYRAGFSSDSTG